MNDTKKVCQCLAERLNLAFLSYILSIYPSIYLPIHLLVEPCQMEDHFCFQTHFDDFFMHVFLGRSSHSQWATRMIPFWCLGIPSLTTVYWHLGKGIILTWIYTQTNLFTELKMLSINTKIICVLLGRVLDFHLIDETHLWRPNLLGIDQGGRCIHVHIDLDTLCDISCLLSIYPTNMSASYSC